MNRKNRQAWIGQTALRQDVQVKQHHKSSSFFLSLLFIITSSLLLLACSNEKDPQEKEHSGARESSARAGLAYVTNIMGSPLLKRPHPEAQIRTHIPMNVRIKVFPRQKRELLHKQGQSAYWRATYKQQEGWILQADLAKRFSSALQGIYSPVLAASDPQERGLSLQIIPPDRYALSLGPKQRIRGQLRVSEGELLLFAPEKQATKALIQLRLLDTDNLEILSIHPELQKEKSGAGLPETGTLLRR